MEDGPRLTNGMPSANSMRHETRETYPILQEKMIGLQNHQSLTQCKISGALLTRIWSQKQQELGKKNPRRRRESKRNKISNKQNNCETRTLLSRPLQNKRREIADFFLRPFRKETSTENFFPSMFQNGHKLLNTLYWLTLGYLRLFSCSRGSYSQLKVIYAI